MFVDIYNLGRGSVSSVEDFCKFTINNLQVLRGYRYVKIPGVVRKVACGPMGEWKPGDPDPQLEIVMHHESPVVYPRLPERWRTDHFQAAGTARRMVLETNERRLAHVPEGVEKFTLDMKPAPPSDVVTPNLDDILPGLTDRVSSPDLGPRPPAVEIESVGPVMTPRPPPIEVPTAMPPTANQDVLEAAISAASDRCQGEKGDGTSCPRRARPESVYCGAHGGRKAVLS